MVFLIIIDADYCINTVRTSVCFPFLSHTLSRNIKYIGSETSIMRCLEILVLYVVLIDISL